MGLSISYDRIMEIEDWIATATCERFVEDGVVSPASLKRQIFTVGALDNLDHNPSSTTSLTSSHGTGISLFQFTRQESGPAALKISYRFLRRRTLLGQRYQGHGYKFR